MPNLGCVAADPSIGCEIDCVENRQLFTEIFPVGLALDYDSQRSSSSSRQTQKRRGMNGFF